MAKNNNERLLLNQPRALFNSIDIGKVKVILSSLDTLSIGTTDGESLGSDYSALEAVHIYAENLVVGQPIKAKKAVISAHSLVSVDSLIDVSGGKGYEPPAQPDDKDKKEKKSGEATVTQPKGQSGGNGEDGGAVFVYTESIISVQPPFTIKATGGQGGGGQLGSYNKQGGDGGNGGKGGHVEVFLSHQYTQWLDGIKSCYQEEDLDLKKIYIKKLLQGLTSTLPKPPDVILKLCTVRTTDISIDELNKLLWEAAEGVGALLKSWKIEQERQIDVAGGVYGVRGEGITDGKNGQAGLEGSKTLTIIRPIDSSCPPEFLNIHPMQCAMTLNKAKLDYMFLDPVKPRAVIDLVVLFNRLHVRTKPFVDLKNEGSLVEYWREKESSIGSLDSIKSLQKINLEANRYLKYLKSGQSFFGYESNYVPMIGIEKIQKDGVEKLLESFGSIDAVYKSHFEQLAEQNTGVNNIKTIRKKLARQANQMDFDIPVLKSELTKSAALIDEYKNILVLKKESVDKAIEKYKEAIKNYFNIEIQDLIKSLSTVAFAPESKLMWLSQAGELAYNGYTEITNLQGQPVRKEFIVHTITTVQSDLKSLSEGFKINNSGQINLDDPGVNMLVGKQREIEKNLDEFYGKFPQEAAELKEALKSYVDTVTTRNTQILNYNCCINLLNQNIQMQDGIVQQTSSLNEQQLKILSSSVAAMTEFISESYYLARNNVIQVMDLAARAYKLWTLTNKNILTGNIGDEPLSDIDAAVLRRIQGDFWYQYTLDVINKGPSGSSFGKTIKYSVTDNLNSLKENHKIYINIKPQLKDDPGPFGAMAEVRISHVCVYINGAKTDSNELVLSISHGVDDTFVSRDNQEISFTHKFYTMPFKYNLNNPDKIIVDADFRISASGDTDVKHPITSPFTNWLIDINPIHNPGLDLMGVTSVDLVFDGQCVGFSS